MVKILAFESSCDETSVAYFDSDNNHLSQVIDSQIDLHAQYGGVVPELASRSHLERIRPLTNQLLKTNHIHNLNEIDYFAYTKGPGLVGALLVGASFSQALAIATQKPVIPVHHLAAHATISMYEYPELQPPYLCLLVSGGHTMILEILNPNHFNILGKSLDDAAGEAFDKGGKILGLDYPGGPAIEKEALYADKTVLPKLPLPMKLHQSLDMSFSGLKTAFNQAWQKSQKTTTEKSNFAWALEQAIIDSLLHKTIKAVKAKPGRPLVIAGGVAANKKLRHTVKETLKNTETKVYYPSMHYCTDNAAMIAYQAYLQHQNPPKQDGYLVKPRWDITSI